MFTSLHLFGVASLNKSGTQWLTIPESDDKYKNLLFFKFAYMFVQLATGLSWRQQFGACVLK